MKKSKLLFATDAIASALDLMPHVTRVFELAREHLPRPWSACIGKHGAEWCECEPQYVRLCWTPLHAPRVTLAVWCFAGQYRVGELEHGIDAAHEERQAADAAFRLYAMMLDANAPARRAVIAAAREARNQRE